MTFISIVLLFQRFSNIQGWSLFEVALCYGIVNLAYSTSECFARGFDMFSNMIRTGSFDRIMLRPRGTMLQVFGSKFEFTRLGRFIQSLAVLIFALVKLDLDYTPLKILTLILMISCGVIIFTGIYIIGATLCFFTIDGVEIMNIFTDGGREMAKYPLGIYKKSVQKIFTFIIPFGVVNYYPLMFVLGKSNNLIYAFMPLYGIIFFIPCIWLWSIGVKHYKSTGT
jgi:ABC-2 type transport system permease protein